MNKIKKICIILLLISFSYINLKSYAATGTVTANSLRIRKEASTNSEAITSMSKNEKVEILGEEGDWYHVKFEGQEGYASKKYIKQDEVSEEVSEETSEEKPSITEEKPEQVPEDTQENDIEENITEEFIGKEFTTLRNSKLRLKPNFSSITITSIDSGENVKVINRLGNWVEITGNDKTGWICIAVIKKEENTTEVVEPEEKPSENITEENVVTEEPVEENQPEEETQTTENTETTIQENNTENTTKGYINYDTVKLRETPSTDGKVLGFLDLNNEVEILGEDGDWYHVKFKDKEGYIAKRLISPTKVASRGDNVERNDVVSEEANNELNDIFEQTSNESQTSTGQEIVNFAKQYLGYSYVHGGKTPESGFDCSGFTRYVFSNYGISLGGTAASQEGVGTTVAREDLQPGDLILFEDWDRTKIGHTGIYVGDNIFIHAANPTRGVVTDNLETNTYYSERFVSAERFF